MALIQFPERPSDCSTRAPITGRIIFQWSIETLGFLEGRTAIGRATIDRLQINDSDMVRLRQLLAELGLFAELQVR